MRGPHGGEEVHFGAMEANPGAVKTCTGAMEAKSGAGGLWSETLET
jgi:hypothetical protein